MGFLFILGLAFAVGWFMPWPLVKAVLSFLLISLLASGVVLVAIVALIVALHQ